MLISVLAALLASCGVINGIGDTQKAVNGSWVLKSIATEGIAANTPSTFMNDADFHCFIGSLWALNSTTGLGTYTVKKINGTGCPDLIRTVKWTITEKTATQPASIRFVKLGADANPVANENTYTFYILEASANALKLKNSFETNGKTVTYTCNFEKIKF